MAGLCSLPLRREGASPPPDLPVPVPPARRALFRGGRPLKRRRYIAAFDDEVMLCAGSAQISWWAVGSHGASCPSARGSVAAARRASAPGGRLVVRDPRAAIELDVDEGATVQSVNAHGERYVWTRKQAARPTRGRIAIGERKVDSTASRSSTTRPATTRAAPSGGGRRASGTGLAASKPTSRPSPSPRVAR